MPDPSHEQARKTSGTLLSENNLLAPPPRESDSMPKGPTNSMPRGLRKLYAEGHAGADPEGGFRGLQPPLFETKQQFTVALEVTSGTGLALPLLANV